MLISSGDDLITPVYVAPTRPPPTKFSNRKKVGGEKPCDDEDCFPGSGFGPVTEDTIIPSSRGRKHNIIFSMQKLVYIKKIVLKSMVHGYIPLF